MKNYKTSLLSLYSKKRKLLNLCNSIGFYQSLFNSFSSQEYFKLELMYQSHIKIIENIYPEESGRLFLHTTNQSICNSSLINSLSLVSFDTTIRICNEIIEDDINDTIRNILEDEVKFNNKILNSTMRSDILKLRDEYKEILHNEIISTDSIDDYKNSIIYKNQVYYIKALKMLL